MLFGKYVNKYYLKYALYFIIGLLALIIVDYKQLDIPKILGGIVNSLKDGEAIDIKQIVVDVLIVAAVLTIGRITWRLTLLSASKKIEASLRKEMFLKAERLSQRYYHENKVGNIMSWFTTDLETIEEFYSWGTIMLVDAIFLSIFVIVEMLRIDWVLSLMAFIPIILIIVWGGLVEKFMAMKWDKRQKAFDELYDFSQENFTGIRVIKAFVKENQELHAFARVARKNYDVNIDFVKTSVIFDVIIEIICAAILCLLLGFGSYFSYRFLSGNSVVIFSHVINLKAGDLVTFITFFDSLIWPMIALGQIISMRSRAKASLKRVSFFLDQEEEIVNPKNAITLKDVKGEIEFRNFNFIYPDGVDKSLKNISFKIKAGETIGIVGKIGSGKTTLVNSLLRLYNIDAKTLFIDGYDIMDCDIRSVRDAIGYVPQDNFLFSDKIRNNIAFSNQTLDYDQVIGAAKFADVDDNIKAFKEGYDTISGERGVTLSGGQKQRVSIARAFIKNAPIMIMDDSVSAVDVKTEETILHNIKEYRRDKTTIVIASRVSTVAHLDKVLVLNDGCLEAYGTHEELLASSPTYQKMVYLQALEREVEGGNL